MAPPPSPDSTVSNPSSSLLCNDGDSTHLRTIQRELSHRQAPASPSLNRRPYHSLLHGTLLQRTAPIDLPPLLPHHVGYKYRHVVLNLDTATLSLYRCSPTTTRRTRTPTDLLLRDRYCSADRMSSLPNEADLFLRIPAGKWCVTDVVRSEKTLVVAYEDALYVSRFGGRRGSVVKGPAGGFSTRHFGVAATVTAAETAPPKRSAAGGSLGLLKKKKRRRRTAGGDSDDDDGDGLTESERVQIRRVGSDETAASSAEVGFLDDAGEPSATSPGVKGKIVLQCPGGGNEKAMWTKVVQKVGTFAITAAQNDHGNIRKRSCSVSSNGSSNSKMSLLRSVGRAPSGPDVPGAIGGKNWRYRKESDGRLLSPQKMSILIRSPNEVGRLLGNNGESIMSSSASHFGAASMMIRNRLTAPPPLSRNFGAGDAMVDHDSSGGNKVKEYRVQPSHAYANQWMTGEELNMEMLRTSSHFHDLRPPQGTEGTSPIVGSMHVEVLSATGLPKLDRFSDTDAVVYLVLGSTAFCTDVIPQSNSPKWPCKARRACIFPLHHAYSRLYAGVFDDDGDFAGRVAIDVATLRPASLYDVSLPLRQSTQMYTRRPRGMIRLRFRVEWIDESAAVLSYLPARRTPSTTAKTVRPESRRLGGATVTIPCGDKMAFRSVALTVHGTDMHGKFSKPIMKATSRELKLYKLQMKALMKGTISDVSTWANPAVSAYVLGGWMHCVYASSVRLVLPYGIGFVVVCLLRNYARCVVSARSHGGYAPLTIRELLLSLIRGHDVLWRRTDGGAQQPDGEDNQRGRGKRAILSSSRTTGSMKPLEVKRRGTAGTCAVGGGGPSASSMTLSHQRSLAEGLFTLLGFFEDEDDANAAARDLGGDVNGDHHSMNASYYYSDHIEFPFSDRERYKKMSLEESVKDLSSKPAPAKNCSKPSSLLLSDEAAVDHALDESDDDDGDGPISSPQGEEKKANRQHSETKKMMMDKSKKFLGMFSSKSLKKKGGAEVVEDGHLASSFQTCSDAGGSNALEGALSQDLSSQTGGPSQRPLIGPNQNMDVRVKSTTIFEDLAEFKDLAHKFTLGLINDKVFVLSKRMARRRSPGGDTSAFLPLMSQRPTGKSSRSPNVNRPGNGGEALSTVDSGEAEDEDDQPVIRVVERSLGIGVQRNPMLMVAERVAGPMVQIVRVGLMLFRAMFNLFMWKDPYLSFWFLMICVGLIVVTILFPWRLFLFLSGLCFVGPQNFVRRKWKSRKRTGVSALVPQSSHGDTKTQHPAKNTGEEEKESTTDEGETKELEESSTPTPFMSHFATSSAQEGNIHNVADTLVFQEVVVPYSPLRQERFYDWPPEPSLSRVTSVSNCVDSVCCDPVSEAIVHRIDTTASERVRPAESRRKRRVVKFS